MLTSIDAEIVDYNLNRENKISLNETKVYWKRPFDIILASIVSIFILIWLIPAIGIIIKLTSRGPSIYVQWRTGRNGRIFPCLKFRTMTYEKNASFRQATLNDIRITRIGKFLRRTNLDEMPQFLNVMAGHMSIVGPRPHAIQHDAQYWTNVPNYHKRYFVRPGITGLAQIRGARGLINHSMKMEHRLRYDLLYIKNRSLWYDIKICWWTLKKTVQGDQNAW